MRQSCLDTLADLGVSDDDVVVMTVPGALEIPGVLSKLAQSMQFDALIAIGAVIRGETYHFEVVSNESAVEMAELYAVIDQLDPDADASDEAAND
ncbi:MAG: hypothetical protein EBS62_06025 [Betaproteobacteria bacterium]|nr:hypothetical protein [Betaproteobacteria bacterium]